MKVDFDLYLSRMSIKVAKITGQLDVEIAAEELTGSLFKEELFDTLKEKDLKGDIYIDGKKHSI